MMPGAQIAIRGWGPNHPRNLHSSFSYQLYVLCQYLIVGLWEQSLPVTLLSYLQNITTWDIPMMLMLTHGLWIIICCKHHGEIICFVSKQAAQHSQYLLLLLTRVKALRSVHFGYLGHLRGGQFCMIWDGSMLRCAPKSPKKLCLIVPLSPEIHVSCEFFVICQWSLSCSFVRSAECPPVSVYCLQQYAACSNNTSLDLSPGL